VLRTENLVNLLAGYLSSNGICCDSQDFVFEEGRKNPMLLGLSIGLFVGNSDFS
jgi:hypothetical protein